MIEKIIITSFQAHGKLVIEFDRHVTTIVGSNDVGKSAALRALRWVCLNQPSGDEFIKWGSPVAWVKLYVDGHTVVRKRGDKINSYKLDDKEFRSFGVGAVPDEIAKVLQINELNFQQQIEPPFWFTESAGQVSKQLNQIINLGSIDNAMSAASSEVRRAQSNVELTRTRLEEARQQARDTEWAVRFNKRLTVLERLDADLQETRGAVALLTAKVQQGKEYARTLKIVRRAAEEGAQVVALGQRAQQLREEVADLEQIITGLKQARALTRTVVPDINPLLAVRKEADKAAEARRDLEHFITDLKKARKRKCRIEKELLKSSKQLEELRSRVKKCPTCGQLIPSSPSCVPTSTSHTSPRSQGRLRVIGTE